MNYWPGTNIKKSKNNAFDWRGGSKITNDVKFKQSYIGQKNVSNGIEKRQTIIVYSRPK